MSRAKGSVSGMGAVAGVIAAVVAFYMWGRYLRSSSRVLTSDIMTLPGDSYTYWEPAIEALGIPAKAVTVYLGG